MTDIDPSASRIPVIVPGAPPSVTVSVDNSLCQRYGICQSEAAAVFDLGVDGRLRYQSRAAGDDIGQVRQAARCCPTQAITLTERRR